MRRADGAASVPGLHWPPEKPTAMRPRSWGEVRNLEGMEVVGKVIVSVCVLIVMEEVVKVMMVRDRKGSWLGACKGVDVSDGTYAEWGCFMMVGDKQSI